MVELTDADLLEIRDDEQGVRALRWNRSKAANAFDDGLVERLLDEVRAAARERIRILVLSGGAGRFSAGFDLRGEQDDRVLAWRFVRCEQLLAAVRDFPGLTVASVVGPAFGAGADLVTSCAYRIGDPTARFRFPGPRFGVVLGTDQLRSTVGATRAMDILLRGETVDASAALRDGLLTHIIEADQHTGFVRDLAADVEDVDGETLRALLYVIRPARADSSLAALTQSVHRPGLAANIEEYRSSTLR